MYFDIIKNCSLCYLLALSRTVLQSAQREKVPRTKQQLAQL